MHLAFDVDEQDSEKLHKFRAISLLCTRTTFALLHNLPSVRRVLAEKFVLKIAELHRLSRIVVLEASCSAVQTS